MDLPVTKLNGLSCDVQQQVEQYVASSDLICMPCHKLNRNITVKAWDAYQVKLPVAEPSELSCDVQQQVEQGVEDDDPAPQYWHGQLENPLSHAQEVQITEGVIAVDDCG